MSLFRQIKSILNKNDAQPETTVSAVQAPTERRRSKRHTHQGRNILIIDDSTTIVASLARMLKSAGCRIEEAGDAETGLEAANARRPDLVFLDIVLPGMNGFAALRQMRRNPATQDVPVIMISGNEQATEQFYAKRIGADDFMKKPFSRHEVFARLEALIAAGKLPDLETGSAAAKAGTPPAPPVAPSPAPAKARPRAEATANLPNETVATMTPMQARQQLTSMGLQYFSQEQFSAAITRGDKLAVDLFIIGGGIEIKV